MKKVTYKKGFLLDEMSEMYEDFRKMRLERKIDKILDSLSETSFIEDNPPDEGKENLTVSARPYENPEQHKFGVSNEQTFPGFMEDELTDDNGIVDLKDEYEDENEEWEDSEYDDGPAEEQNDQKEENEINHVPNQKADELYDDIRDEMLGEMIDNLLEQNEPEAPEQNASSEPPPEAEPPENATDDTEQKVLDVDSAVKSKVGEMVDNLLDEGLQGPGGKFGFMGEDGHKGYMGEDSNADE
jgi:hypothetical protein